MTHRELYAVYVDNGLVSVNVERPKALEEAHKLRNRMGGTCEVVTFVETERVTVGRGGA